MLFHVEQLRDHLCQVKRDIVKFERIFDANASK